jgi:phage terminase large subunit-like protein
VLWLPEPEQGTPVALGFDGSDVDDWTAIRARVMDDGFAFTPRFGSGPTIWNPAEHPDHRVPRAAVSDAVDELFDRFDVVRMYCDPPGWQSEIDTWALRHGEERVLRWETYRPKPMSYALERYVTDLVSGAFKHDGCPIVAAHVANAVKSTRKNDTYVLAKASKTQKIDAAMADVLAHEARADALAAGWEAETGPTYFRLPR